MKVVKEKNGKYRLKNKITIKDALLVLIIICLVLTIVFLCEV